MKEYRVRLTSYPGPGPRDARFIELEDENGHGIGGHEWVEDDPEYGSVYLVLPVVQQSMYDALVEIANSPVSVDKAELLIQMETIKNIARDAIAEVK